MGEDDYSVTDAFAEVLKEPAELTLALATGWLMAMNDLKELGYSDESQLPKPLRDFVDAVFEYGADLLEEQNA